MQLKYFTIQLLGAIIVILALSIYYSKTESSPGDVMAFEGPGVSMPMRGLGLTIYNKAKALPGYTLFPVAGSEHVYLLNMEGNVVHSWPVDATRARLLPNCNLLVVHGSKFGAHDKKWRTYRNLVREYDWNGNVVWSYKAEQAAHHDINLLPNGNVLFPIKSPLARAQTEKMKDPVRRNLKIRSDTILEVTREGEVAWSWAAHEHLDLDDCGVADCYRNNSSEAGELFPIVDWTHMNTTRVLPENKWYDNGDKRFKPGNVVTFLRTWWTAMIIDKSTKKVVWDYSGDYRGGLGGGHEPQMIEKGYPGEGNILLLDNGSRNHKDESFILEIDPLTKQPVWIYDVGKEFFTEAAGSVQRLRNGNTFIAEDNNARAFEVTPEKEIVWEYRGEGSTNRSHKYDVGYCEKLR